MKSVDDLKSPCLEPFPELFARRRLFFLCIKLGTNIDPPYNTGKEFIYPDNYTESLETYLAYAGLIDDERKRFSTNTPNEGRFHTKWLNMMYPRLYLARNLLLEDGVIFISIDDTEVSNLRKLCDEIFGEENFVGHIVWQKKYGPANDTKGISQTHEHIMVGQVRNVL